METLPAFSLLKSSCSGVKNPPLGPPAPLLNEGKDTSFVLSVSLRIVRTLCPLLFHTPSILRSVTYKTPAYVFTKAESLPFSS